jgi:hypothetical protein
MRNEAPERLTAPATTSVVSATGSARYEKTGTAALQKQRTALSYC